MIEELRTDRLSSNDRVASWNEAMKAKIALADVHPSDRDSFHGRMKWSQFQNFEILCVNSEPATIVGGNEEKSSILNLQIQHIGTSLHKTRNGSFYIDEGDFVLYDSKHPIYTEFSSFNEVIIIRIPIDKVSEKLPNFRELAGIPYYGKDGVNSLFSGFFRDLWGKLSLSPGLWIDTIDDLVWPMLELPYGEKCVAKRDYDLSELRRKKVFSFIDDNLCDPDLDIHRIASSVGISVRGLQILFAEISTTPTTFLKQRRLDLAGERLKREGTKCQITNLAYDVGFNDLSAFCRAFKLHFKVTPREYRAGVRHRPRSEPNPQA